MAYISVAVDGPAGAGKSSVSKKVASDIGYTYIDTGAMYRAAAVFAIENGIDIKTEREKLISRLDEIKIELKNENGVQKIFLNGSDVTTRIRETDATIGSSDIAVIPEVRVKLVKMQQEMAKTANVIMDGRDICSTVLPDAQVKIFLTASAEARAKRRYDEMTQKGMECDLEKIKRDIEYRDKNDSSRAVSPLKQTDDATLVDTTDMTFDEVVERIKELIRNVLSFRTSTPEGGEVSKSKNATLNPRPQAQSNHMFFYKVALVIVRFVMLFIFRLKIEGKENVPKEGGVIIAYNHRSYWDPVVAGTTSGRKLRFMAKEELFKNKFFGGLIKSLGAFPITRGRGDIGAIKGALKILKEGSAMLIFPEGKRVRDGKKVKAKPGVAAIAHRARVPVVPASIKGEYKWMHKITVTYAEPVYLDFGNKMTAEETQAAADNILEKIRENL